MADQELVRTQRVPVAEVLEGSTRQEFYQDLRSSLKRCVAATNRCITECVVQDREAYQAVALGEKVPRKPKIYTYPVLQGQFPGSMGVAASLARSAEKHYSDYRFEILTGKRSLSTQRSCPMPLLHNKSTQNLKLSCDADGNIIASFQLLSGHRYTVRLRGGSNYSRPLKTIRASIEQGLVGDSKIWVDRRGQVILGIACKVSADKQGSGRGVLSVSTARESFIVATKEKTDTPFVINADHVRGWQSERNRRQQRLRQDRKSGSCRRYVKEKQAEVSRKHQDRLASFTHEAAAHIVQHARRRKVRTVRYDDTIRRYFGKEFPWFEFRGKLRDKCEEAGIDFQHAAQDVTPAELDEPHVYFHWNQNGAVKVGKTENGKQRKKDLENASGVELICLATEKLPKTKLRQREREYHAKFADYRLKGEWFEAEPVIQYLRDTEMLGNSGNLSQIQQYMEA